MSINSHKDLAAETLGKYMNRCVFKKVSFFFLQKYLLNIRYKYPEVTIAQLL